MQFKTHKTYFWVKCLSPYFTVSLCWTLDCKLLKARTIISYFLCEAPCTLLVRHTKQIININKTASSLLWFFQVMVTNVTSLLKTVKAVEDEATRGTRALEATVEYIKQQLTVKTLHNCVTQVCQNTQASAWSCLVPAFSTKSSLSCSSFISSLPPGFLYVLVHTGKCN